MNQFKIAFERIKSTDFPLGCRAMYYFEKGRHAHQERDASGVPYYVHPRGVAYIVMMVGGTNDQINAALGHDLLEDTETSFLEIAAVSNSLHCAELCSELRNNKYTISKEGKESYISYKLVSISDDALTVKLADMLYNLYDKPKDTAKERMFVNYNELIDKRTLNKQQEILCGEINRYFSEK